MRYKTINWITNKKSPNYKPTSPQAKRSQDFKPQAKGSSFKPESTSSRIREPGYKRTSWSRAQATRINVFFIMLNMKRYLVRREPYQIRLF